MIDIKKINGRRLRNKKIVSSFDTLSTLIYREKKNL